MSSYHIESNFIPGSRKFLETLFDPLGEQKTKPQLFNSNASWLRCFLQVALWRKPPRADSLSRQEHLGMPRQGCPLQQAIAILSLSAAIGYLIGSPHLVDALAHVIHYDLFKISL